MSKSVTKFLTSLLMLRTWGRCLMPYVYPQAKRLSKPSELLKPAHLPCTVRVSKKRKEIVLELLFPALGTQGH